PGVAGRLVRPFDPGKYHGLAFLRLHRAAEVGDLAVRDVVSPAFDDTDGAELDEHRVELARVFDELLAIGVGHCEHAPIDIGHGGSPALVAGMTIAHRCWVGVTAVV